MDLNQKKKNRFRFLETLYDSTNGSTQAIRHMRDIGRDLQFSPDETSQIVEYLRGERLIKSLTRDGAISLTHEGVLEIEQARDNPTQPTHHFPPINIINIGSMNNYTLQQGSSHSTINFTAESSNAASLSDILQLLKEIQNTLDLPPTERQELQCELQTLESQHQSPQPKSGIITESLKSVKTILETVMGNAGATLLGQQIGLLLSS